MVRSQNSLPRNFRPPTLLARKLCELDLDPNFVPCKIDLAKVNVSAAAANLIRENSGKGKGE